MLDVRGILPPRSMADVISQVVRVRLAGAVYPLPAKVIVENERWKAQLDVVLTGYLQMLDETDDAGAMLAALAADTEPWVQLLLDYDHTGLLPDRDTIRETTTELELMVAVLECWRAANPKVDIALAAAVAGTQTGTLPGLTSSPPIVGAGARNGSEPT